MLLTCFIESCEYKDGICTKCHLTEQQKIQWPSMSIDQRRAISNITKWKKQQERPKAKSAPLPSYMPVFIDES